MFTTILEIAITLVLILANGFFSGSEIAVVSARRSRLQQRADTGDRELWRYGSRCHGHLFTRKWRNHAQLHLQRKHVHGTGKDRRLGLDLRGSIDACADDLDSRAESAAV